MSTTSNVIIYNITNSIEPHFQCDADMHFSSSEVVMYLKFQIILRNNIVVG